MNPLLDKMQKWINDGVQTLLSILKIVIYSKNKTPMPTEFDSLGEIVILGNGPSLNTTVASSSAFLRDKTLLAVNFAGSTDLFKQLCPGLYVIADPYFFFAS